MAKKEEVPLDIEIAVNSQLEATLASTGSDPDDALVGKVVADKFEILSRLGSGGMSIVYKARHLLLNKPVALKILQVDRLNDPKDIRRFQQEAQAASSLSHPNIGSVREFGLDEDSHPYIVMDFIEAVPLAQLIKDHALPSARALRIAIDVCRGLEHAHDRGVVHRDIKPDNILIAKNSDGCDLPLIVDFGIARITLDDQSRSRLTQTGEVFGTPTYMSPEQALGVPIDRRSDVYSLGCVMYEMLAGKQPFEAENPLSMLMKHVSEPPSPMSDIPAEIQSIVMKAMAKDPTIRYESAAAFRLAMENVSSNTQIVNMPEWGYAKTLVLRVIAWIIDLAIISLPGWIVACFLPQGLASEANRSLSLCGLCEQCMPSFGVTNIIYKDSAGIELIIFALLICIANYLYHAILETSRKQATLGKQVVGLIATNNNFGPLTFREASYRHWSKTIYFGMYLLIAGIAPKLLMLKDWGPIALLTMSMLALLAVVLRKRYQMVHDVISSAKVVPCKYGQRTSSALEPGSKSRGEHFSRFAPALSICWRLVVVVASICLVSWGAYTDVEAMMQARAQEKNLPSLR